MHNDKPSVSLPVRVTRENSGDVLAELPAALRLLLNSLLSLRYGSIALSLPDGRLFQIRADGVGPAARIDIRSWSLARRILIGGSLGLAEGYLDGDWDSPDVTALLELFCVNEEIAGEASRRGRLSTMALRALAFFHRNTKRRARKNIAAHYDLGNAFYSQWLDDSMTYSAGIFSGGENDLQSAQMEKYRSMVGMMQLQSDHTVLEIGCGWGGFAEFAATEIGCKVTALTISREQYEFASKRIFDAKLNDKVTIRFQDYRDEVGRYDRIASIEMFEAVGEAFWPVYFGKLNQSLNPGGIAGIQVITIPERFFAEYRSNMDFIQRYIFPGGMLPTPGHLHDFIERFGFAKTSERIFGRDYAATIVEWRRRFHDAWPAIGKLGFDDRFWRMWNYYFHYCEAGFKTDCIDVRQLAFQKTA